VSEQYVTRIVDELSANRQLLVGKQFIAGQSPNTKRQIVHPQVWALGGSIFLEQVAAFIHYQQLLLSRRTRS
jgi:hypothetical protein